MTITQLQMSLEMISKQSHQRLAEVLYIDSVLNGSTSTIELDEIDKYKNVIDIKSCEHEENFQLVLISGMKFAFSSYEIMTIVESVDVEICDKVLEYEKNEYVIKDIVELIRTEENLKSNNYFILIKGRGFAVPCKKVLTSVKIKKAAICCRKTNSKRQWLAGTVRKDCIAIVDLSILQKTKTL